MVREKGDGEGRAWASLFSLSSFRPVPLSPSPHLALFLDPHLPVPL